MCPPTDQELVDAMNRGDVGAFETLYRRHRDWVYRIAFRFCANTDDALEATQDVFVFFLGKFPGFRLKGKLTTFLYPCARSAALSIRRRQRRLILGGALPEAALELTPPVHPDERSEDQSALAEAIRSLGPERAEILLMRYADGMAIAEIANALGITQGAARSRLHRAIEDLRSDPDLCRRLGMEEKN